MVCDKNAQITWNSVSAGSREGKCCWSGFCRNKFWKIKSIKRIRRYVRWRGGSGLCCLMHGKKSDKMSMMKCCQDEDTRIIYITSTARRINLKPTYFRLPTVRCSSTLISQRITRHDHHSAARKQKVKVKIKKRARTALPYVRSSHNNNTRAIKTDSTREIKIKMTNDGVREYQMCSERFCIFLMFIKWFLWA